MERNIWNICSEQYIIHDSYLEEVSPVSHHWQKAPFGESWSDDEDDSLSL